MEISYKITEEDYIDFNLHHMNTSKTARRTISISRFIGPIMCIIAIFVLPKITNIPAWYWSIFLIIMGIVWFITYPKSIEKRIKKQVKKMIGEGKNKDLFADSTLTVNEEEIFRSTEYTTNNIKWSGVNKIDISDKHIFIYDTAMSAIIIPLSVFDTVDEKEEFIAMINRYYKQEN